MVTGIQFLSLGLLGEMLTLASAQEREGGHVYEVFESSQPPPEEMQARVISAEAEEKGRGE